MINESHTYTIIIRLWVERNGRNQSVWRGSLECVQTGERASFQTLAGLAEKVAQLAGEEPAKGDSHFQK